ncbi:hypothetical protein ACOACQ_08245 [Nocardioides sp. CPCC 206347]|uniref:hypothetical protein n=1 Tax=unclassified Nocardioides TaxID=2615069 RepID=UPI00361465AA
MSSQLGRRRIWERREERSHQLIRRAQRIEAVVLRVLNTREQLGRSPRADLDVGRALSELRDVEGVAMSEIVRLCGGALDRAEVERLTSLARPQSDVRRSSDESPRLAGMTANRDELIHLIEGMPDDQVDVLLADAKRLAESKPRGTWPPKFVGMVKDGPTNGSSPEYIDTVMSRGFGSER